MTSEFDADTAVTRHDDGSYSARLTDQWNVGERPNGGYLMATALRAVADAVDQPHPLTVTCHFLRPPTPGLIELDVEVVRQGRSLATGAARMTRDGVEYARIITAFGDLTATEGATVVTGAPPDLPPPEACPTARGTMPGRASAAIVERFDLRFHPATLGWARDAPTGRAEVGGWIRFADGRDPDLLALVQIVDAFPPTVFDLGVTGWVPTLELTVHLRARPAPGWLRAWLSTRFLIDGYLEEDAEVYDADGALVAQSRQLARLIG